MKWVLIESPFAGDVERNRRYVAACLRDCLLRGEVPMASHALYTLPGVLDDNDQNERLLGMTAGWAWLDVVDLVAVYTDLGVSPGMRAGMERAVARSVKIERRSLGLGWVG